ncbi:MAG: GGDEF domain-containing protein [Polyangiaceae bacterium]|nr:GGDEF domain-containing protein [Polyangiaceae bacterium]
MSPDDPDEPRDRETLPTFVDFDAHDAAKGGATVPVLIQTAGLDTGRLLTVPEGTSVLRRARGWEVTFDLDGEPLAELSRAGAGVACTTFGVARVSGRPGASHALAPGDRLEAGPVLLRFQEVGAEEARALGAFYASSRRDGLTGLANARALDEHVASEVAYARRHREPLSVLVIDLDGSSARVAAEGFEALDPLVRRLARTVAGCARDVDLVARTGPDELSVARRGATREDAAALGEAIRAALSASGAPVLTVSVGVASLACLGTSDRALLDLSRARAVAARTAGGDRVIQEG